ncbi:unnamed protein product [Menidia menidia]|uniref:(Atlantic silverside) hypothetical protein n=1 Tax=Menidia menidia TaxID=238744 RepID=A0A8S4BF63_9TELE|nr:unnamed protein product [Menidia menidia]
MQHAIDVVDEERYDTEAKQVKTQKEIDDLKMKVVELAGVKKPALKKVRMSADDMLKALLGSKHTVNMDLRANLKQVKKEVKEEEKKDLVSSKEAYMSQNCPGPDLAGDQATLMETCKKLAALVDKVDEDRYDLESKVGKADKEVRVLYAFLPVGECFIDLKTL